MLKIRFLSLFIDPPSVKQFLHLIAAAGMLLFIDLFAVLWLSRRLGPWLVLALLAAASGGGLLLAHVLVGSTRNFLNNLIDSGIYSEDDFNRYLSSLVSAVMIILPGFLSTLFGSLLILPPIVLPAGRKVSKLLEIEWPKIYEHLRLSRLG